MKHRVRKKMTFYKFKDSPLFGFLLIMGIIIILIPILYGILWLLLPLIGK